MEAEVAMQVCDRVEEGIWAENVCSAGMHAAEAAGRRQTAVAAPATA